MKLASTFVALILFGTSASSLPTEAGVSFDVSELSENNISPEDYFLSLSESKSLSKRQYSSSTYNQLTDGTACRPVTGTLT